MGPMLLPILSATSATLAPGVPTYGSPTRLDQRSGLAFRVRVRFASGASASITVEGVNASADALVDGGGVPIGEPWQVFNMTPQSSKAAASARVFNAADGLDQWDWLNAAPTAAGGLLNIRATSPGAAAGDTVDVSVQLPVQLPAPLQLATASLDGLMAAADKAKLDAVPIALQAVVDVPSSGAWTDVLRYSALALASRSCSVYLIMRGTTNRPSDLNVTDWHGFATDALGAVFIVGGGAGTLRTFIGGAGTPPAPTLVATVPDPDGTLIRLAISNVDPSADGLFIQVSTDGGATWGGSQAIGGQALGNGVANQLPVASTGFDVSGINGVATAGIVIKFRLVAYNQFGCSVPTAVQSATTPTNWPSQFNGNGGGNPILNALPVSVISFDDLTESFIGFTGPGVTTGDLEVQVIGEGTDYLIRARTHNAKTARIGYTATITLGGNL